MTRPVNAMMGSITTKMDSRIAQTGVALADLRAAQVEMMTPRMTAVRQVAGLRPAERREPARMSERVMKPENATMVSTMMMMA